MSNATKVRLAPGLNPVAYQADIHCLQGYLQFSLDKQICDFLLAYAGGGTAFFELYRKRVQNTSGIKTNL